ncbi:hypothetical protein L1987_71247 [Smallanthus sonchifolius]|uniref:Uncharacterized protein n=1 Tax=Smallanthus sonchifolius TaxID=185202 RepID=A0ACB9ARW6_9ASTR|nr:hypothetical protein L1987_71247 [Smallanthus sonchifolius]
MLAVVTIPMQTLSMLTRPVHIPPGSLPSASSSASQMEIGNSEIEAEIAPLGHNSDLDVENEVLETVNVGVGLGLSGIHGYQLQIRVEILDEGIQFIYQ